MKTLAFFFALISPVFARLGESLKECEARYGEPTEVDQKLSLAVFAKAGFTLAIQFEAGRAGMIVITKNK